MPRRPTIETTIQRQSQHTRDLAKKLAIDLARLISDTRCTNVVVLDVTGACPITDFLVLGTGTSPRQMRSVADEVIETAQLASFKTLSATGFESNTWICVDLIDVIFHAFSSDARAFYDLDNLWADAVKVDWEEGRPVKEPVTQAPQE